MLLEIKKQKNKFVLLNPPKRAGAHFYIDTASGKIIPGNSSKNESQSQTYLSLKKMVEKYPNNDFLKLSLELTPKDYAPSGELSNEQLLNEALTEKYGI